MFRHFLIMNDAVHSCNQFSRAIVITSVHWIAVALRIQAFHNANNNTKNNNQSSFLDCKYLFLICNKIFC